jgi:hypothetical protein
VHRSIAKWFLVAAATVCVISSSTSCDSETLSANRGPVPQSETRSQEPSLGAAELRGGNILGSPTFTTESRALVHPAYVRASQADYFLTRDDIVFVIRATDATYVFPRMVMGPHHIVNETIDGNAVIVTYCQLSECATLFSRVVNGEELTFSWLQALYSGTLLMGDYSTGSLWIHFLGRCLKGSRQGQRLTSLDDIDRMSWSSARALPGVKVLDPVLDVAGSRSFLAEMETERLGFQSLRASLDPTDGSTRTTADRVSPSRVKRCFSGSRILADSA